MSKSTVPFISIGVLGPNNTCFAPSLVKEELSMWKTCLLGLPFGLFSCVLLVYLTLGSNPYVIVLKIKNATSQSNLSKYVFLREKVTPGRGPMLHEQSLSKGQLNSE